MAGSIGSWLVRVSDPTHQSNLAKHLETLGATSVSKPSSLNEVLDTLAQLKQRLGANLSTAPLGFLLDLSNGVVEVAKVVRAVRESLPLSPVIISCAEISGKDLAELLQAGVSQVIPLSCSTEALSEKIRSAQTFQAQVEIERKAGLSAKSGRFWVDDWYEDRVLVRIVGWISESSKLPEISRKPEQKTLVLDCDRLFGMNSIGIRLWVLWLKQIQDLGFETVVYENARRPMLRTMEALKLKSKLKFEINSFYVAYFSEETETEIDRKVIRGRDYNETILRLPRFIEAEVNGKPATFEFDETGSPMRSAFVGRIDFIS